MAHQIKISEPNFRLLDTVKSFKPNIIFNALHGQFGEDESYSNNFRDYKYPILIQE